MSQAVIHGDTVWLAGQVGERGASLERQIEGALMKVDALLARAGSDRSHILRAQLWLADIDDFAVMDALWRDWIDAENPPARATCETRVQREGYAFEIIVTAAINKQS